MEDSSVEQGQHVDDEVGKNLPLGVKLVRTLRGHTGWIGRIAWSPDGRMLASSSEDKTIRLWDVETGECLRTLEGHEGGVWTVGFDPAGSTLASGSVDKTIKLWEPASGRLLYTLKGHKGTIQCTIFDRARGTVASGSNDGTVKLWEPVSGTLLRTLIGHAGTVYSVAFDSTGSILASGSNDGTVKLWEPVSGTLLHTLIGHTPTIRGVAFLANSRLLASTSFDDSICLWRTDTYNCVADFTEFSGHSGTEGIIFHPILPLLATVGSDPGTPEVERDHIIHIYELDLAVLFGQSVAVDPNLRMILPGLSVVGTIDRIDRNFVHGNLNSIELTEDSGRRDKNSK